MEPKNEDVFVIGGGEIYKQSINLADMLDITRVHTIIDKADAFFPEINESVWEVESEVFHSRDDRHQYDFTFQTFKKRDNNSIPSL